MREWALDGWAFDHGVELYFIDPGKPTQNAYIESFNGRFHEERLNLNWFTSLNEAQKIIDDWRMNYDECRLHSSLIYQTPSELTASRPFTKIRHGRQRLRYWGLQPSHPLLPQRNSGKIEGNSLYLSVVLKLGAGHPNPVLRLVDS